MKQVTAGCLRFLLLLPIGAFAVMRGVEGWDLVLHDPSLHFYLVSAASLLSALIGVLLAKKIAWLLLSTP